MRSRSPWPWHSSYGVQLRAEDEATKRVFASLKSLAQHIDAHRPVVPGA